MPTHNMCDGSSLLEKVWAGERIDREEMRRLISDAGYEAHQRDNWYNLLN
jgi:2-iminoacetate synthase ThiH